MSGVKNIYSTRWIHGRLRNLKAKLNNSASSKCGSQTECKAKRNRQGLRGSVDFIKAGRGGSYCFKTSFSQEKPWSRTNPAFLFRGWVTKKLQNASKFVYMLFIFIFTSKTKIFVGRFKPDTPLEYSFGHYSFKKSQKARTRVHIILLEGNQCKQNSKQRWTERKTFF